MKKKVLCISTMGAFSGDGAGNSARLLKKYGAIILGGLHIIMPDSVCDNKLLKKTLEKNKQIVLEADEKLKKTANEIKEGKYPKEGLSFINHLCGLFGQRLWFYGKANKYSNKLKISEKLCVKYGLCARNCPMENIKMINGIPTQSNKCTMCYRCISKCPQKAITLLGKEVVEQCNFEKYSA